jgi:hypothetical protein
MKQPEYTEGSQALQNFKSLASAILQANLKKKQPKKTAVAPPLSRSLRQGGATSEAAPAVSQSNNLFEFPHPTCDIQPCAPLQTQFIIVQAKGARAP